MLKCIILIISKELNLIRQNKAEIVILILLYIIHHNIIFNIVDIYISYFLFPKSKKKYNIYILKKFKVYE